MKKKVALGVIATATAATMMLAGCEASNAGNASNMSEKTAKRSETVVARLDKFEDKHYNFPKAFGNDFFVTNYDKASDIQFRGPSFNQHNEISKESNRFLKRKNTRRTGIRSASATPEKDEYYRYTSYKGHHFTSDQLNKNNAQKQQYFNRLDDLYMLCADISAANSKQNKLIDEIRGEAKTMKSLSGELKNNRKLKANWSSFNHHHERTGKALNSLYRDRGSVKKTTRMIPKANSNLNPEALEMRYQVVMNKLNGRIEKLEATKQGLYGMNQSMRTALGKPEIMPKQQIAPRVHSQPKTPIVQHDNIRQPKFEIPHNNVISTPRIQDMLPITRVQEPQQVSTTNNVHHVAPIRNTQADMRRGEFYPARTPQVTQNKSHTIMQPQTQVTQPQAPVVHHQAQPTTSIQTTSIQTQQLPAQPETPVKQERVPDPRMNVHNATPAKLEYPVKPNPERQSPGYIKRSQTEEQTQPQVQIQPTTPEPTNYLHARNNVETPQPQNQPRRHMPHTNYSQHINISETHNHTYEEAPRFNAHAHRTSTQSAQPTQQSQTHAMHTMTPQQRQVTQHSHQNQTHFQPKEVNETPQQHLYTHTETKKEMPQQHMHFQPQSKLEQSQTPQHVKYTSSTTEQQRPTPSTSPVPQRQVV